MPLISTFHRRLPYTVHCPGGQIVCAEDVRLPFSWAIAPLAETSRHSRDLRFRSKFPRPIKPQDCRRTLVLHAVLRRSRSEIVFFQPGGAGGILFIARYCSDSRCSLKYVENAPQNQCGKALNIKPSPESGIATGVYPLDSTPRLVVGPVQLSTTRGKVLQVLHRDSEKIRQESLERTKLRLRQLQL